MGNSPVLNIVEFYTDPKNDRLCRDASKEKRRRENWACPIPSLSPLLLLPKAQISHLKPWKEGDGGTIIIIMR